MEAQRPNAIMRDEKAVALVTQMGYDFDQVRKIRMSEGNKIARILLTTKWTATHGISSSSIQREL